MSRQIKEGTLIEITGLSPKDAYNNDSAMRVVGMRGCAGELLEPNEFEQGYYQGDFKAEDGSCLFFYAIKIKIIGE